jgi:hypothetical protein
MTLIITALVALTSPIDPKVRLVVQEPQAGSQQWRQVVFNSYCYEKAGDAAKTETRTRAMLDIMGQASRVLAEKDTAGMLSMRTYSKGKEGEPQPRLHIVIRPDATQAAHAPMDVNAELASLTEKLLALGFDFGSVPSAISGNSAVFVGFLRSELAKRGTTAAVGEIQAEGANANEPPKDF